jgi:small subunit ribosomal protein S3
MEIVDKGFAIAIKKLGIIGCRVRIVPPMVKLPGRFKTVQVAAPQAPQGAQEKKPAGIGEIVKAAPAEVKPEAIPAPQVPKETATEEAHAVNVEERMHGDVLEHKHPEYDYWHPASRVHKKEEK